MPSGCTQLLATDRQQNLKLNSPSRRLSLKRLFGPAPGVHFNAGSLLSANQHIGLSARSSTSVRGNST